jgi:hypothetical protein
MRKPLYISRSWREFDKQQAIGILSFYKKIYMLDVEFHLNINGEINQQWLDYVYNFIPVEKIILYKDDFLKDYARKNKIKETIIDDFEKWKWIYHILLYHYLWKERESDYILTFDDDILFNSKEISEIIRYLETRTPFGLSETNAWSDKSSMKKMIFYFDKKGIDVHDIFWKVSPQNVSINSGFLGMKMDFFENYDSLNDIVNFFTLDYFNPPITSWNDISSWNDSYGILFDSLWNILLQEQSFLVINQKVFYPTEFRTLQISDGYNIELHDMVNDEFYPLRTKLEHYLSNAKHELVYKQRIMQEKSYIDRLIELGGNNIENFYKVTINSKNSGNINET